MGCPAVSCSSRISIEWIFSGFFFPPACARHPFCAPGPLPRPEPTTVVVREPRCEDRGRRSWPVDDRRHGPVSAIPVRHTNGAVVHPASCRTRESRLSILPRRPPTETDPALWGGLPRRGESAVALDGWYDQRRFTGTDRTPPRQSPSAAASTGAVHPALRRARRAPTHRRNTRAEND